MKLPPAQSNWENKKYVLKVVKEQFTFYEIIANYLKDDEDILIAALSQNGTPMKYASKRLRGIKDIAIISFKNDKFCFAYEYLSQDLRSDKEVAMLAVATPGMNLQHASEALRDDKDVVLLAVSNFGDALACVSDRLKNDKEVVLTAVMKSSSSIRFASSEISRLVFKQNPVDILTKHVNSEKLQKTLSLRLEPKSEKKQRKI